MAGAGTKIAAAVAAGVFIASQGHGHHHGPGLDAMTLSALRAPGSIAYSRTAWAKALLRDIPEPRTHANVCAIVSWEVREGGGFGNQAENNPLNLNPGAGAGWPGYPATGAWAFPSASIGLAYTVMVIRGYPGILAVLHAGDSTGAILSAVVNSPWASDHYGGYIAPVC